ncbi:beta/gamma crystallin domain-containing protein [Xenorhabdus koppenhoeferi]|uniref:Membrane binding n=1 Tax=Xenorhabdus koppenhoeferi TaxID=351659 RepID=A0A1I7H7S2_9GAMM|nr:beta/gamma crystallin domain-containing protein [Xenorhabdus koppenhoeferi]SFU56732.1 Membrane binding [Xenorhabdus koppenhoeferi]
MSKDKLVNGAVFYTQKNYAGDSYKYPENSTEVNLVGTPLNDKFLSVEIGTDSIVLAWRHGSDNQSGQIYREWDTSQADISDIQGLSRFIVLPSNRGLLSVKLVNESGVDQVFRAHIQTYKIPKAVEIYSNGGYEIVGLIPKDGLEYVTSIAVFDQNHHPVTHGAIYFKNNGSGVDIITHDTTKPPHMRFEKASDYQVILYLENYTTHK